MWLPGLTRADGGRWPWRLGPERPRSGPEPLARQPVTYVADQGPEVAQRVQGCWLEPRVPLPQGPPAPRVEMQELVPEPHPGQPLGTVDGLADLERLSQFSRSLPPPAPFIQPVTLTACLCWAWWRGAPRREDSRLGGQTGASSSGLGRGRGPGVGRGRLAVDGAGGSSCAQWVGPGVPVQQPPDLRLLRRVKSPIWGQEGPPWLQEASGRLALHVRGQQCASQVRLGPEHGGVSSAGEPPDTPCPMVPPPGSRTHPLLPLGGGRVGGAAGPLGCLWVPDIEGLRSFLSKHPRAAHLGVTLTRGAHREAWEGPGRSSGLPRAPRMGRAKTRGA